MFEAPAPKIEPRKTERGMASFWKVKRETEEVKGKVEEVKGKVEEVKGRVGEVKGRVEEVKGRVGRRWKGHVSGLVGVKN